MDRNFSLSNAKLSSSKVAASEAFSVSVDVAGAGPAGLCVVQVYFSQQQSSRVRFDRMLLGFTKVRSASFMVAFCSFPL